LQEEIRKSPHTAMVQGLSHTAIPTSFSQYGVNEAIQHSLLYEVTRICAIEKALHDQWQKVNAGLFVYIF
jgi:hypothetical protein